VLGEFIALGPPAWHGDTVVKTGTQAQLLSVGGSKAEDSRPERAGFSPLASSQNRNYTANVDLKRSRSQELRREEDV